MNIIIKTPSFIGDTIMMLPALELLKLEYPYAKFTIVCKENCKDVFREKGIDKIIIDNTKGKKRVSKTFALIKTIKEDRYDLGVLFHNTFLDALSFKLSNIKTIIGYDKESRKILLDFWIKIDRSRHYVNHYANLVNQYLDNKYSILPPMKLNAKKQNIISKDEKLLVGFVLGSVKDTRGYPIEQSLELFELLKNRGFHIVLLGDANDAPSNALYEKKLLNINTKVTNLSAKTTVGEYIDTVNALDLLITIDTSAIHIAAATKTPFIALIGKGSSPFEVVKPKVDFGSFLFKGDMCIKGEDFIKQIKVLDIVSEIDRRLKLDK